MYFLILGCLVSQPSTEPPTDSIKGLPPFIVKATVKKDRLVSVTTVLTTSYKVQTRQVEMDGKVVTIAETVPVTVERTVEKSWDLKKAKIANGSGKKIDLDTLRKRLAVETPVVVSADGKPIAKGYLTLIRAEVIVIEAPLVPDPMPIPPK